MWVYENVYYVSYNLIHLRNVSGDENLHDIPKHAPDYDSFVGNNNYTILYKGLANL